ncbi:hypothetical protein P0F40_003130 [Vibrio metschnikovii]|nr:hypothetical protein [Vibrio metschnikovii]EKO3722209.1 hypothetical protein [Vibrio metschnikovii]EKO3725832.1 hypothetical protein [Vibrio metschnikovii]EKO3742285.1 hypothetical protein [Vibrio metschnikovii]EKO3881349.1 hypothetical protein [Vibrio metschnikovii]
MLLTPQIPTVINTSNLHKCLEDAKLISKKVGEQNILLELQIYLLRIDLLIANSRIQSDWRTSALTLDKILRKLLGFSKQIESFRDNHVFSTQYCLDSALEQVKVLITVTCKAIDLHQQDWTPC